MFSEKFYSFKVHRKKRIGEGEWREGGERMPKIENCFSLGKLLNFVNLSVFLTN